MKNRIRVFTFVLLIAVLFSALCVESYASGGYPAEGYKERTAAEVSGEAIAAITEIVSQSGNNPVKQIAQTANCAAVLMEDGTVKAFFHGNAGTFMDYSQCQVSSWRKISTIAVGPGCIYGLNESGKIIWEGMPGDLYADADYTKDKGWQKISKSSGYTDIACIGSMLFALSTDGTIDYAFIPEYDYDGYSRKMCENLDGLTGIVDIERIDNYTLCTLSSLGEILLLRNTDYFGEPARCIIRQGAVAVKLHEGSICAVMGSGKYDVIDEPYKEDEDFRMTISLYPDLGLGAGAVREMWADTHAMDSWLFRTEYGEMGRVWFDPDVEYACTDLFGGYEDWRDVNDAYVFRFVLPETFPMYTSYGTLTHPDHYRFDIALGVKTDGSCVADYYINA